MADIETLPKTITELNAEAEASNEELLAIGDPTTAVLRKISVKNHAESIKNIIVGDSADIQDIADGTVTGAIIELGKDISQTQEIITEPFSESMTYSIGDLCIYDNVLYRFKEGKEEGEWDEEIVEKVLVKDLIDQKNELVSDAFSAEKEYEEGDYCIYNNILYKFIESKEAGEWDEGLVEKTNITAEFDSLLAKNKAGSEFTATINTAGYLTSSNTNVLFMIPITDKDREIDSIETEDTQIRQNGYLTGSSSGTEGFDGNTTFSQTPLGTRVTWVFPSSIGGTNNDAVGVCGTLTINFK